jgi:ubiquinone/menaquinone biosynthesis C-methylase UbiE
MSRLTDQAYLRGEQYRDSARLAARAGLHQSFSTNPQGWPVWAFEQLDLRPGQHVLEVGGGPGWLWRANAHRLPAGLRVTFTDFSPGIVREARAALSDGSVAHGFRFANADAQALPLPAAAFDGVIANHMLYHVPDLARAVGELARVLRPGGRLCAATNGPNHLRELYDLAAGYSPWASERDHAFSFRLDNAAEVLRPAFEHVEIRRYPDSLWVTEARPVVDYLVSMSSYADLAAHVPPGVLEAEIQACIDRDGGLHITKDSGVALAWNE